MSMFRTAIRFLGNFGSKIQNYLPWNEIRWVD